MTLNLAFSLGTPFSLKAKYRPSRSLTLGEVTVGPPGELQTLGGGGFILMYAHAPITIITSANAYIL